MVLIWGANFSVIKRAFEEMPAQAFNAVRLVIASSVFWVVIRAAQRRARAGGTQSSIFHTPHPLTPRDRLDILWLGLVGHMAYQFCFVGGVAITSVSNAALIVGTTPVLVATLSAVLGRERIGRLHWVGAAISVTGIYFVVGRGAAFGGATLRGDALVMASVGCWAAYTLGAGRLMARHSPLYITGATMAVGAVPYVIAALPAMLDTEWTAVRPVTYVMLLLSALLALNVAYLIWYIAVQRIGPARTAIYSNVVPIIAMAFAAVMLGERITRVKMLGAAAVLGGVFLTRFGRRLRV
jgi:drug/metabolite transporter (DMT)-like permease